MSLAPPGGGGDVVNVGHIHGQTVRNDQTLIPARLRPRFARLYPRPPIHDQ